MQITKEMKGIKKMIDKEFKIKSTPTAECPFCGFDCNQDFTLIEAGDKMAGDIGLQYKCSKCNKKYIDVFSYKLTDIYVYCGLTKTVRTFDWCKNNCSHFELCDNVASAQQKVMKSNCEEG